MSAWGTCRLCRNERDLRRSHILPAWSYRLAGTPGDENPNPVVVQNDVAVQSSKQITEHLLCATCEQRFGDRETYVRDLVYGPDRIAGVFTRPGVWIERARERRAVRLDAIDTAKLAYFGISVIWRSHVASGKVGAQVDLGAKWGEHIRRFLLDEEPLSKLASMIVAVVDPEDPTAELYRLVNTVPVSGASRDHYRHEFFICGFAFHLFLRRGTHASDPGRNAICLIHAPEKWAPLGGKNLAVVRAVNSLVQEARPGRKLRDRMARDR